MGLFEIFEPDEYFEDEETGEIYFEDETSIGDFVNISDDDIDKMIIKKLQNNKHLCPGERSLNDYTARRYGKECISAYTEGRPVYMLRKP